MAASYLEASLDRLGAPVQRDDTIEICINPDGQVWGEFQGDHFMRALGSPLSQTEIKDLGNQIASAASTTLSTKKPIVSVSILYRDRPIRAQVIQPPAVEGGFSISLRFFSSLPLEAIKLGFLYGKERSLEGLRRERNAALRDVVAFGDIDAPVQGVEDFRREGWPTPPLVPNSSAYSVCDWLERSTISLSPTR